MTGRLVAAGQLLLRSRTEIAHLLQAMRDDGDPVAASVKAGETLFISSLLEIEPLGEYIVIARSENEHANRALLAERSEIGRAHV